MNKQHSFFRVFTMLFFALIGSACSEDKPFHYEPKELTELQKLGLPDYGLPVLVIETPNRANITSKEDWLDGASFKLYEENAELATEGTTSIKGRGNTTWLYPKKPFALKLESKTEILGMPKHKRWALLANWMDRTLIRNAVAFEIGRQCKSLGWTPKGQFVELVLNGLHLGNYYLCEQVKVDKNRVNISDEGFLMELDVYYDEVYKFHSSIYRLPWMFKDPDEVTTEQFDYMKQYVNNMESALNDEDRFAKREFAEYMDLESFADWWIVNELTCNEESQHPKSCYMHKDKDGKMIAGPLWDFDWGTFRSTTDKTAKGHMYYPRLFKDKEFVAIVKAHWKELKPKFENIKSFIDDTANKIHDSEAINHVKWPISQDVNGDERDSFDGAISKMKNNYTERLKWLDSLIQSL